MALTIYANVGTQDVEYGTSGAEWVEIDTDNDRIIFSAGSDSVKDGEPSPSDTQLNQAGIILTGSAITIDKYLFPSSKLAEGKIPTLIPLTSKHPFAEASITPVLPPLINIQLFSPINFPT